MSEQYSPAHATNQESWSEPQQIQQPQPGPPGPVEPTPQSGNRRLFIALGIAAVLIVGAAVAAILASTGSSGPKPIAVNGTVTVTDTSGDGISSAGGDGSDCTGADGYSDLTQGAEVVISDDTGKTLTITELGAGKHELLSCIFHFTSEVPAGKKYYGVTVTHRGTVKLTEAEIKRPDLTIGS